MRLVRAGDPLAFAAMFDRNVDAAFSLAYRMCGERGTAEDIVQDTFLSLWRAGSSYDHARGSVRSWVLSSIRNRAIDRFRHDAAHTGQDINDDQRVGRLPAAQDTAEEVCRLDGATHLRDALTQLPSSQRHVIELAYFRGFSHREIAEMLGLPAGTVKGRMRLGLTKLRLAHRDLVARGAV